MKRDLMIFRFGYLGRMKKWNRSNLNLTGTRRNCSSGPLLESKRNKITLHYKNTEKKMTPK